ncbi:MAG: membrane protein insertion efficiency factor YidD [Thermodesulfobacteriota bacterium]
MLKKTMLFAICGYKSLISPLLPPACRFYPSCSNYATESIESFGVEKGFFMALKRLLRCHPFNPGGYDPVPEKSYKHGDCF